MARFASAAPANGQPAAAGPMPARRGAPSLESDYPRVLQAIQSMWGYPELNQYFRRLTMDERGGRDGFPPEVWEEIYLLLRLHQQILPEPLFR